MSVVLLGGSSPSTWIVCNALARDPGFDAIIIENHPDRRQTFRRRAARLGWWCAGGQLLFSLYARFLGHNKERLNEILRENQLSLLRPEESALTRVSSVNSDETLSLLRRLAPKAVVVNGTRIISRKILDGVDAAFINTHAGITPKYRGVHGAYWALAKKDAENAGVTVHLIDPGIDTGPILYQARIRPTPKDDFSTYPFLQLAAGIPLLRQAVCDAIEGKLRPVTNDLPSQLHYHPTIWSYLANRIRTGVK
jgi:folate-dependent phosphoribosylglycinamide formyltransferase PurN